MATLTIVMAQINPLVGDIRHNTRLVIDAVRQAECEHHADVVVFPELTLCGYPPEDLLLRSSMALRIQQARLQLQQANFKATVIVGYPKVDAGRQFNVAGVLQANAWIAEYAKQQLPNYQVFDEQRYFDSGSSACVLTIKGLAVGLLICEDIWSQQPIAQTRTEGAELLLVLNASPFHRHKQAERLQRVGERARQTAIPIVYVNQVGGQDELVFDGGSFAVSSAGECQVQAPLFTEGLYPLTLTNDGNKAGDANSARGALTLIPQTLPAPQPELAIIYQALVLGLRDYVNKNGFKQVLLGLSGGIDSALTLAIAVDALGCERVSAVMMPFAYTSVQSREDAAAQARCLGVDYQQISIAPMYQAFTAGLAEAFAGTAVDLTEQNLQARCRGVILMALSNKTGALVLTTGNKSEMAVGYTTLYGDMAGGFDVLKDVPKTTVFALARYRNRLGEAIPLSVIERPPSAELAPDQVDEDNLPPYDELDRILEAYIERDQSAQSLIAQGFAEDRVYQVIRLVDLNEYKRRQAPIGVRISKRGFGRDRRYPITNGWQAGD
ncbi:MAG: NAD+ synthase [Cellvibrionaceae bacterium]|nr:NAD+ synthase [Cellvibrionaceae bacterium]